MADKRLIITTRISDLCCAGGDAVIIFDLKRNCDAAICFSLNATGYDNDGWRIRNGVDRDRALGRCEDRVTVKRKTFFVCVRNRQRGETATYVG